MTKDEHYYVLRGLAAWMGGYLDSAEQHGMSSAECGKLAKSITTALSLWPGSDSAPAAVPVTGNPLIDKLTSYAVEMAATNDKLLKGANE